MASSDMKLEKILEENLDKKYTIYNLAIRDVRLSNLTEKLIFKIKELKPKYAVIFVDGANMVGKTTIQQIDPFQICPVHKFLYAQNEDFLVNQLKLIIPYFKALDQAVKLVSGKLIILWTAHQDFSSHGLFSSISSCSLLKRTLPDFKLDEQKIRNMFDEENLNFEYVNYLKSEKKEVINNQLVLKLKVLL